MGALIAMKTYAQAEAADGLLEASMEAISKLRKRLEQRYEQAYPDLGDIIRHVIDKGEANAWNLSPLFPHLVLPDLVEAHIAQVGLQPVFIEPDKVVAPPALIEHRDHPAHAQEQVYVSIKPEAVPIY
jgi:hypothetical protein